MRIAALLTTHNRRDLTLSCLERLGRQILPPDTDVDTVLVDAGSVDGTPEEVQRRFPATTVIEADASLFWTGGMARAFGHALSAGYDAYLLLNDDTDLYPDALLRMASRLDRVPRRRAIVVGTVVDPHSGDVTYGGWTRIGGLVASRVARSPPGSATCDTFNANCVLIGNGAAAELGNLDVTFQHGLGDMDYGFRAASAGVPQFLLEQAVGTCEANKGKGLWTDQELPLRERWRRLLGPKGLPPREWLHYCKAHAGKLWPVAWAKPYLDFWLKNAFRRRSESLQD